MRSFSSGLIGTAPFRESHGTDHQSLTQIRRYEHEKVVALVHLGDNPVASFILLAKSRLF